ncbi:hypothetical protein [Actinoplanes sp. L3-i22]|uniref:hypothetical protein n=1 Tax=Actinoplanes sp. L3-i22 TaxID=2836373 RepID=UPI001C74E525|nr:hypothetical protein [Actinoplanes sp. L3-i22]BCY11891.1 hypothetical protein L3i22_069790 [Actinoplanes sp. L3-i22]
MKRWRWAVVAAVVAGLVIVVRTATGAPVVTGARAHPQAPATRAAPAPRSSPADGGLRVTEQGFTQRDQTTERTFTPGFGPGRPEPYKPVYSAFTLQNTSTRDIAFGPVVKVTYYDDKNRAVGARDANWTWTGPVMPGASVTYAGFLSIDSVRVRRMTVEVTAASWLPAGEPSVGFAGLTARDVKVLPDAVPGLTTVTWAAVNASAQPVMAAGLVIYRDKAGKLLGAQPNRGIGVRELTLPPGDSTGSATYRTWFPPGTDRGRLQVTLRPGFMDADR